MAPRPIERNTLFYGDNLDILREFVPDESVDLIYLDPPFNSNRSYNVLFKDESGREAESQITAFEDTWHWNASAEATYLHLVEETGGKVGEMIGALLAFIGRNQMMAYLVMMAARLVELHRVLKPTGSLYLHCDPTASHYLKIVLDAIFGPERFRNEVIWKRSSAHNDARARFGDVTDTLMFYSKNDTPRWNPQSVPLDSNHVSAKYTYTDPDGRRFTTRDLRSPNPRPNLTYDYKGYKPHPNGWSISRAKMEQYDTEGRLWFPSDQNGRIRLKLYLDESRGLPLQNLWDDIPPINSQAAERLGYPTQKPLALLERIIQASSNPGDVVLDPFCVTGDTLVVTDCGLRPIAQINPGDSVLTHTGHYRKVIRRYERPYEGELLTIRRARSNIPIRITPNHPVLALRTQMCPSDGRRCLPRECHYHRQGRHVGCPDFRKSYRLEWVDAGELREGDWAYYPNTITYAPSAVKMTQNTHFNAKQLPCEVTVTPDLMEWLGYYAAEGFVDTNSVHFANYEDAEHIADLGASLFGISGKVTSLPYRCKHIRFNSRPMSEWIESCVGRGAANKHLPEWVLGADKECRKALIRAMLRSDGSFRRDKKDDESHSYRYGSASPTLSHQLMRLLLLEGVASTFEVTHLVARGQILQGREINPNHPSYRVNVYDAVSVNRLLEATGEAPPYEERTIRQPYDSNTFGNGMLYSIKRIDREHTKTAVYNLEIEEDHSYVTATFTVHNCGCGTSIAAAQGLGRRWIGIDVTYLSIALIINRMRDMYGEKFEYDLVGMPRDLDSARRLAEQNRFQFQLWALSLVGAKPLGVDASGRGAKKGADRGVDGVINFIDDPRQKPQRVLVQVKSGHVKSGDMRDLRGVIERENAALGLFICLEPITSEMQREADAAGFYRSPVWNWNYPRLQLVTVGDLLHGSEPKLPPQAARRTFKQAPRAEPDGPEQLKLE